MIKKKDEFYEKFAQAFHEVVVPLLQDIDKRFDKVETNLDNIDQTLLRIDKTLTRTQERSYEHGDKLDNHERRIHTLEKKQSVAA